MQKFEEEYRARFKAAQDRSGVDEDQLWADILEQLPASEQEKTTTSHWWLLLPLCFAVSILWGDWPQENSWAPSAGFAVEQSSTQPSEQYSSADRPTEATQEFANATAAESTATAELSPTVQEANNPKNLLDNTTLFPPAEVHKTRESSAAAITINSVEAAFNTDKQTADPLLDIPATLAVTPKSAREEEGRILQHERIAALSPSYLEIDRSLPIVAASPLGSQAAVKRSRSTPLSWGLHSGYFQQQEQFESHSSATGYNQLLANAHRAKGGFQVELRAYFPLGDRWLFTTGLGYNSSYATFDYSQERDTVGWRDNQVGGELISAIATRRVRHQQQLQWISLPLLFGTESRQGAWGIGLQLGVGLNYLISQEGRSLSPDEEFIDYGPATDNPDPFQRFFLAAHLELPLSYQLNDRLAIQLRPRVAYQMHGQSAAYELRHNTTNWGLNLGLIWQ
ncbi:MAG: outer membrane beta-barrel protein [Bacteroidota bacterium]